MKEIGGYFQLEIDRDIQFHKNAIYLNSCRNALRYIIRAFQISRIYVPAFTCPVVFDIILAENCEPIFYHLDKDLFPETDIPTGEFVIYNNYFGVTGNKVKEIASVFPRLIVDNAQAFYAFPAGFASIYSPRKFFGVPDGGLLIGENIPGMDLYKDVSYDLCSQLLIRWDLGPQAGYADFRENSKKIAERQLKKISYLTKALLGNINYDEARKKRLSNFNFLKDKFGSIFSSSRNEEDVPLIYPFFHEKGEEIRKKLIENKIFCATYWPGISGYGVKLNNFEESLYSNIIAIPVDQRYDRQDMERIGKTLQSLI